MISLYMPGQSILHRTPASAKLLALAAISIMLLPVENLAAMLALCALAMLAYALLGREGWRRLALVRPLIPFLLILLAIHLWFGSLMEGLVAISRIMAMVFLANLVTITTRMDDMAAAVEPLFWPLKFIGLSARQVALAIAMMIRFVPLMFAHWEALAESWRARSARKPNWRLFIPFFIQTIDVTDNLAEALAARGGSRGPDNVRRRRAREPVTDMTTPDGR